MWSTPRRSPCCSRDSRRCCTATAGPTGWRSASRYRTDLTLTIETAEPTVSGFLECRASLFDPASAQRILEQLRTLLDAALADPDSPIGTLPLDTPERIRAAGRAGDLIAEGVPPPPPV